MNYDQLQYSFDHFLIQNKSNADKSDNVRPVSVQYLWYDYWSKIVKTTLFFKIKTIVMSTLE